MRLLLYFFIAVTVVVGVTAGINRWVDPFGEFYDRELLEVALSENDPCLINQSLVGRTWLPFKEEILHRQEARKVVVGTSRVLGLHSWESESDFANLGLPNLGVEELGDLFRRIRSGYARPLTVYLGVEPFWFNRAWEPTAIGSDLSSRIRYLISREALSATASVVRAEPDALLHRWEIERLGDRCVLDLGQRVVSGRERAWEVDGSIHSISELAAEYGVKGQPQRERELQRHVQLNYSDWERLDPNLLRELDEALALARAYRWRVVGFAIPYSNRFRERLETSPETADRWRAFGEVLPAVFAGRGFPFLDLRDIRDVGCGETEFAYSNDGWHPARTCSMRVRAQLDRTARRLDPRVTFAAATSAG